MLVYEILIDTLIFYVIIIVGCSRETGFKPYVRELALVCCHLSLSSLLCYPPHMACSRAGADSCVVQSVF